MLCWGHVVLRWPINTLVASYDANCHRCLFSHSPVSAIDRVATRVISNLVLASGLLPGCGHISLARREHNCLHPHRSRPQAMNTQHAPRSPEPCHCSCPRPLDGVAMGIKEMTVRAFGAEGQAGWGQEGVRAFQIADHLGSDRAQWLRALELDKPESRPGSATSQCVILGK